MQKLTYEPGTRYSDSGVYDEATDRVMHGWQVFVQKHEDGTPTGRESFVDYSGALCGLEIAAEKRAQAITAAAPQLLRSLQVAVRQNEHDMLMTGEELRDAAAVLAISAGIAGTDAVTMRAQLLNLYQHAQSAGRVTETVTLRGTPVRQVVGRGVRQPDIAINHDPNYVAPLDEWTLDRKHGALILTPSQAMAAYSAMCVMKNVGGIVAVEFDSSSVADDGTCITVRAAGLLDERYANQAAFAAAYFPLPSAIQDGQSNKAAYGLLPDDEWQSAVQAAAGGMTQKPVEF